MKSASICKTICLACLLFVSAATQAADTKLDGLRERFKERYPKIHALKTDGVIGETSRGYIAFVEKEKAGAAELIKAENADRETLYKTLAEKEGSTPENVAERNAKRNFEKAKSGEYLQGTDGKWQKKA